MSPQPLPAAQTEMPAASGIGRRYLSMVYEAMLLFAITFISGYLFSTLIQQRHGLQYRHAMQVWQFVVLGIYFVGFWRHGGQTLAMKTWRIRVVDASGRPPGYGRAVVRYLLAWMWFAPALLVSYLTGAGVVTSLLMLFIGMLGWGMTALLDRDRQFLHDRLAGTRIVVAEPAGARK